MFGPGLVFSECVPNTILLVFEICRTNLFLATHSETDSSSLLSVAVISCAVIAAVYSVGSSAYIDTHSLRTASRRPLVKIEKK